MRNYKETETVKDLLKITDPIVSSYEFTNLLGLALRKNKKRAHLLVSKILGKHYPQHPSVIQDSVTKLVNKVLDHYPNLNDRPIVVFGYAETATNLGALVALGLEADYYIHSTRYPQEGLTNYGFFEEKHSHSTTHHITPEDVSVLNNPDAVIVLVDDELTTGKTILNTINMLEGQQHHNAYMVVTLTDTREQEFREQFIVNNEPVPVFSLLDVQLNITPDKNTVDSAVTMIKSTPLHDYNIYHTPISNINVEDKYGISLSKGVKYDDFHKLWILVSTNILPQIRHFNGKTLILGVEEDMSLAFFTARLLEMEKNTQVFFSSTTQSPVLTYDQGGYPIQDCVTYHTINGERYAYNVKNYDNIVVITNNSTPDIGNLIQKLSSRASKNLTHIILHTKTLAEPLYGPFFSSYCEKDVQWLLKDLKEAQLEAPLEDREEAIQNGGAHYAESLPVEYVPSKEYYNLFYDMLEKNKNRLAEAVANVSEKIWLYKKGFPVLVSLARAGTPIGVLIKRYLTEKYGLEIPHYTISIVRGKGIDYNALTFLTRKYDPENIIFIDGWTGKGAITFELKNAVKQFYKKTGILIDSQLAVLADPGYCVNIYSTREDYLIPSACLNSTVSGLVSRTVLNDTFIKGDDYHGAKFYKQYADSDVSNMYVDTITNIFDYNYELPEPFSTVFTEQSWAGWKFVEQVSVEYGINNMNLIKPGVGETTRVLLRRVPWKILIDPARKNELTHILLLAEERGVPVEEKTGMPYSAIGLIHPHYVKGATGFNGKGAGK